MAEVRQFETGATRDQDANKFDYEGFYSPLVVERFAEYMHKHRHQADGNLRASDNWQKGIPVTAYMKSLWRHVVDVWKMHRGLPGNDTLEDALCAILFNAQGYLFEILKQKNATRQREYKQIAAQANSQSPVSGAVDVRDHWPSF